MGSIHPKIKGRKASKAFAFKQRAEILGLRDQSNLQKMACRAAVGRSIKPVQGFNAATGPRAGWRI
jgi:hypothetical protein